MAIQKLSLKSLREDSRYLNVNVTGNKKLQNTSNVSFIIWNLPSVITCPFRTEQCEKLCYAKKAERLYPSVSPSRQRNFDASRKADFIANMVFTLEAEISHNESHGKKSVVRIHESGDFYNETYANAWLQIAEHFEDRNVVFMAYTKSVRYFYGKSIPKNMVIRFSLWADTNPQQKALAEAMQLPTYSADKVDVVDNMVAKGYATKCDCADCGNCGKCWDVTVKRIYCVFH